MCFNASCLRLWHVSCISFSHRNRHISAFRAQWRKTMKYFLICSFLTVVRYPCIFPSAGSSEFQTSGCTAVETVCVCVWPALTSSVASSQLLAAKRSQWIVETCKSVRGSGGAVAAVQPRPSSLQTLFPPHVFLLFVSEWKKITSSDGGAAGRRSAAEISLSCVNITVWVGVKVETMALVQIQHVSAHQFITATFQLFVRVTFSGRKMSDICWRVWW